MVASVLEFNHCPAFVTPLPTFVLSLLQEPGCFIIPWAPSRVVPPAVARHTNLCFATAAASHLATRIAVMVNVGWPDPLATSSHRTVHAVPRRILCKLAVPCLLK